MKLYQKARKEYDILQQLKQDNIIKVNQIFINESNGTVRIVSELINGIPLDSFLKKNTLQDEEIISITRQLLTALSYLHQNSIVHRDIKLSNIMINQATMKVTLIDFGIAKQIDKSKPQLRSPVGTRWYKAPEILNGDSYDQKVDCWSLGISILQMINRKQFEAFFIQQNKEKQKQNCNDDQNPEDEEENAEEQTKIMVQSLLSIASASRIKNLLCQLLEVDKEQRITAQQALDLFFNSKDSNQIYDENINLHDRDKTPKQKKLNKSPNFNQDNNISICKFNHRNENSSLNMSNFISDTVSIKSTPFKDISNKLNLLY